MGLTARLSLIALVSALATSISSGQQVSGVGNRIYLGETAEPGEFPFMAALENFNYTLRMWEFKCGGSIIGQRHILTAAHCVKDRELMDIRVKLGCHKLSECNNVYGVRERIVHPDYVDARGNDTAILKLDRLIRFNQAAGLGSISKIRLNKDKLEDEIWGNLTVIGWGLTDGGGASDVLMKVNIQTTSSARCKDISHIFVGANEMCAGLNGEDSCKGDSGGPLFKTLDGGARLQVGVVSRGDICGYFGVYGRVADHYSWIIENTRS